MALLTAERPPLPRRYSHGVDVGSISLFPVNAPISADNTRVPDTALLLLLLPRTPVFSSQSQSLLYAAAAVIFVEGMSAMKSICLGMMGSSWGKNQTISGIALGDTGHAVITGGS